MREQHAQHTYVKRRSLPPEELAARQVQASPHGVGHYAGLHPEDAPTTSSSVRSRRSGRTQVALEENDYDEEEDEEDEEEIYPKRPNMSVRKYHHPQVPDRYFPPTHVTEEKSRSGISFKRFLVACLGVLIVALLIAFVIVQYVIPTWQRWSDDRAYGYPRIIRITANVGHGDKQHPASQFIGINTNGVVDVIEISYGNANQKNAHIYYIGTFTGSSANLIPITALTFTDENGDGKPDMEVVVNNTLYILYNDGTEFKPKQ